MTESVQARDFPFQSVLSLRLLVEYWENAIESGQVPFGDRLLSHIRSIPALREAVSDPSSLEEHQDLIAYLMSAVIAPAQGEKELVAATVPFRFKSIFETEGFRRNISPRGFAGVKDHDLRAGKTIQACLMILQQFYNLQVNFDKPVLMNMRDPHTGLDKVYRIDISRQFCEIVNKSELAPIDPRIIKFLTEKVDDVDLWLQYIRPENFEFRGFMVVRLTDVTEQEMVSAIRYDLIERDAFSRKESFTAIQHKLRAVFRLPDMRLGLGYFDSDNKMVLSTDQDSDCWKSLAESEGYDAHCSDFHGSVYERSWMEGRPIAVEDLTVYPYRSKVEDALISKGIRSILLAPLVEAGESIGMLELASPHPGELNPMMANKLERVLPMFTSAVKRVKEESVTEVRAIIQEECTNIHPVVQWRFFEAGRRVLEKRRRGEPAAFEDIVFRDVHPLFGMVDIRNSSLERTVAIQGDLVENLTMARELLETIQRGAYLPAVDEMLHKTNVHLEKISHGLGAGDEISTLEFLHREINPLLTHFEHEPEHARDIAQYRSNLDPAFGAVYRRRRDFEESLARINTMINNHLNEAQVTAQEMFPHYFEKYQTDGVEYTLYLGTSLTKNRRFDPFFLKNFRIWQLLLSCKIEKRMEVLKPTLKIPLDITQLILVHDQQLAIRFRPDEKQFDVDGAYDIRYEIIKKRIDKATVKGSGERLTQPGHIAVIYNQPKVQDEYRRYFDYLVAKGVIDDEVEDLELDELPGATGLRALRVRVTPTVYFSKPRIAKLVPDLQSALLLQ